MLWAWAIVMTLLAIASIVLNFRVINQNLMLNDQRDDLVDRIEESLDELDTVYNRLSHHAEIPVISDEPIIQEVVNNIRMARNTVLRIASKVVTYGSDKDSKEPEET